MDLESLLPNYQSEFVKCQNAGVSGPKGEENAEVREEKRLRQKERGCSMPVCFIRGRVFFLGRVIVPCWEGRIYVWYCIKGNEKGVYIKMSFKGNLITKVPSQRRGRPEPERKCQEGSRQEKIRVK